MVLGPDGRGGPHAFVGDLDVPRLSEDDHHHLARALRLRDGDPLTVSDGRGRWRPCRFGTPLVPEGEIRTVGRPAPVLTIGFALTKGPARPELVVQKLTELGIDRIVPFRAAHSVARWEDDRAPKNLARLRRIAREAAMQSRRVWLPEIAELADFAELAADGDAVRAQRGGAPLTGDHTTVLIGPEGGWSATERDRLGEVDLAEHVLRAETAAIAAATLMAAARRAQGPAP